MAIDIKVPPVGESITEVTLAAWKKKSGEAVQRDEIICELESDKATFELPAEADGIIELIAKEGDIIPIGGLLCKLEAKDKIVQNTPTAAPAVAVTEPIKTETIKTTELKTNMAVIEIKIPAVGESITEVTIASWSKKEGDAVKMDEVLCELESDKATFELPAEAAGTLHIVAQPGSVVPIGGVVATISTSGAATVASNNKVAEVVAASEPKPNTENNHAGQPSPVAANILAEKGIDPATITGTGVGGKITKEDALHASKPAVVAPVAQAEAPKAVASPAIAGARGERREKMTSLRKTIARRLVAVKNETAMLTTFNEVDMKPIMDLRALYKDKFKEKHGVGLGFMSFFTKAACVALKEFPAVNAKIDGDEIVFNDFCDISIAVSAPKGLMVPVIRNAETLSLAGIEQEVVRLATKAKENKLTLEEMTGGTFTLTNGGIFGSMLSTPIINAPQVAILGMHNIVERAVVVGGQIVVRPIMYLALSYDHRIIDGKDSVSFLVRLKQLLEDPTRLLLDV
jgi:2-oxoglutarate dehydrogenase E2 component (dihydrolipoamide succinyltransferase)